MDYSLIVFIIFSAIILIILGIGFVTKEIIFVEKIPWDGRDVTKKVRPETCIANDGVVVSTFVGLRSFKFQYILVAECIGEKNAMIIGEYLMHVRNLPYVKISSGEDNYWFITDFIGSYEEVIKEMIKIPGAYKNHQCICQQYKDILLRAVTKNLKSPIFALDKTSLKNDVVIWWVNEYKNHFSSDIFAKAIHVRKLREESGMKNVDFDDATGGCCCVIK